MQKIAWLYVKSVIREFMKFMATITMIHAINNSKEESMLGLDT